MANEGERDYWNGPTGQRWADLQPAFDRAFNELTTLLFQRSAVSSGERILDVGCGSGATTMEAARQVGPSGSVLGVDISELLLAIARRRAQAEAKENVEFLLADAQTHAFPPQSFDLVCSRLGVMFFADPIAAFANLWSALKPGGRLCFVCWAPLSANPWLALPLALGARTLGPPTPQPPRKPGPMAFSDAGYVREILNGAGFTNVAFDEVRPVIRGHGTAEEEAVFAGSAGPLSRLLNEKKPEPEVREELNRQIAAAFRPYLTEGGIRIPSTFYCVTAGKL